MTVGAAIIYNKQGQILLCKRADGGSVAHLWEFPGGKLEDGETIVRCIVRECEEELGITLGIDGLFSNFMHKSDKGAIDFHFYNAHIERGKLKKSVHEDVAWVEPCKLLEYDLCPADRKLAQKIAQPDSVQVAVIGGGAAGLAAAIEASRGFASVALLEKGPRVGAKILVTGNGRCNLSNEYVATEGDAQFADFRHEFVEDVLDEHSFYWVEGWFDGMGLVTASHRPGGRVYPRTYKAESVLDVLIMEASYEKVRMLPAFEANMIASADEGATGYLIVGKDGRTIFAERVIVATGGGRSVLEALGHETVPLRSGLCALATETEPIAGLDGIRAECNIMLFRGDHFVEESDGELLFRDYGISGICVFDLSREYEPGQRVVIDLLPEMHMELAENFFEDRIWKFGHRSAEDFLIGVFVRPLARAVLKRAGMDPACEARTYTPEQFMRACKFFELKLTGLANTEHAQVTCGGAEVRQFDPLTLESKLARGVYAAGEVLDIDSICGGYNLHWAWASGAVAGKSAAESL